jgi:hypothetical protein
MWTRGSLDLTDLYEKLEAQWAEPVLLTFHSGEINRNLVRSILGRSSIKIAHLVPIR